MSRDLIERLREAWIQDAIDTACDGENGKTNGGDWEARWQRSRLRAELSSLRGEREQDFGAMKAAEKIILRDYQLGNLTKIGVANRLRGAGFTLEYACKMAHGLPAHPAPDSDVIGRLVRAARKVCDRLSHTSIQELRAALASIPSTEGGKS